MVQQGPPDRTRIEQKPSSFIIIRHPIPLQQESALTSTMSSSTSFLFVLIPCQRSEPIKSIQGDTSGGLTDDYLINHAKKYFAHGENSKAATIAGNHIENLSQEQKKQMAAKFRAQIKQQASTNMVGDVDEVSDDVILSMYMASTTSSSSCDIIALTVPTSTNQFKATSMYMNSNATESTSNTNSRAMELLEGCGHALRNLYGDVFVGRCHDDESSDDDGIWTRVDFTPEDTNPISDWCKAARSGGGGGSGKSAHSLSGSMGQTMNQMMMAPQQVQTPLDGREMIEQEAGYSWSQTEDEVELKFSVAAGTKAKYVKINFAKTSIKVAVTGQSLVQGNLGGAIVIDDSTYTIQDDASGGRELCISLTKHQSGTVWTQAVQK
jgi:hypothetical protein